MKRNILIGCLLAVVGLASCGGPNKEGTTKHPQPEDTAEHALQSDTSANDSTTAPEASAGRGAGGEKGTGYAADSTQQ